MDSGRCVSLMRRFGLVRWLRGKEGRAEEKAEVLLLVWCRGQNQNRAGMEYGGDFAAERLLSCRFFSRSNVGQHGWGDFGDPREHSVHLSSWKDSTQVVSCYLGDGSWW